MLFLKMVQSEAISSAHGQVVNPCGEIMWLHSYRLALFRQAHRSMMLRWEEREKHAKNPSGFLAGG